MQKYTILEQSLNGFPRTSEWFLHVKVILMFLESQVLQKPFQNYILFIPSEKQYLRYWNMYICPLKSLSQLNLELLSQPLFLAWTLLENWNWTIPLLLFTETDIWNTTYLSEGFPISVLTFTAISQLMTITSRVISPSKILFSVES